MKLAYGIFYTNDIKRITDFYNEAMSMGYAFGDDRFVAFKAGNALLGLKISEDEREVPGHQTVILEIENIEELYRSHKDKGTTIYKELSTEEWGKNFAILDPDGNKVEFVQNT